MIHELKIWPTFFVSVLNGTKTHELRRCDDRTFAIGDTLRLREFDPDGNFYTGREASVEVTYITSANQPCALSGAALSADYCILSIKPIKAAE